MKKKHVYGREGVHHLWLIDPLAHTLEVLSFENGRWLELGAYDGNDKVRAAPFEALELDLSVLWLPDADPSTGA